MSIQFRCHHCSQRVQVPDSANGKKTKCPRCGQLNSVPMAEPDDDHDPLSGLNEFLAARRQQERQSQPSLPPQRLKETADQEGDQLRSNAHDLPTSLVPPERNRLPPFGSRFTQTLTLSIFCVFLFIGWIALRSRHAVPVFDKVANSMMQGQRYAAQRDYDLARSCFDEAIRKDDKFVDAYVERAKIELETKDFGSAISDLSQAIELRQDDAQLYMSRGECNMKSGDHLNRNAYGPDKPGSFAYRAAVEDFSNAIRIDERLNEAFLKRALLYRVLGDHDSAMRDIRTVLSKEPKNTKAIESLCWVQIDQEKYEETITVASEALKNNPTNLYLLDYRCQSYLKLKRPDEAYRDCLRLRQLRPDGVWKSYFDQIEWMRGPDHKQE